jgi:hypothetical protein
MFDVFAMKHVIMVENNLKVFSNFIIVFIFLSLNFENIIKLNVMKFVLSFLHVYLNYWIGYELKKEYLINLNSLIATNKYFLYDQFAKRLEEIFFRNYYLFFVNSFD